MHVFFNSLCDLINLIFRSSLFPYTFLKDFCNLFSHMTSIFSCMIQEEEYDIPEELEDVIGRCMILIFHAFSGFMILDELLTSSLTIQGSISDLLLRMEVPSGRRARAS